MLKDISQTLIRNAFDEEETFLFLLFDPCWRSLTHNETSDINKAFSNSN